jgi:UDP-N-acetylmuramoyl-L-alanyl-D-glutamate--2,6-diaminopimelate ligase
VKLSELLSIIQPSIRSNKNDPNIICVVDDSNSVIPGALFVARHGLVSNGHEFISSALDKEAACVVGELPFGDIYKWFGESQVPYVQVENSSSALSCLAAALQGFPSRKLVMIGVTGTDGKTTTCNIIYSILRAAGISAGLITTVNAVIGDKTRDTGFHVTTPDAVALQELLANMVDAGMTHCIVEVTSHGLVQQRVSACEFDVVVLTNITHEHLDYHGTLESYMNAKFMLFDQNSRTVSKTETNKLAVLNQNDNQSYDYIKNKLKTDLVDYGIEVQATVSATNIIVNERTTYFDVNIGDDCFPVETVLVGQYNISNCLAAIASTYNGLAINVNYIQAGIASLNRIPGRMEYINIGQDFEAVVDFAHTPNSLRELLLSVRNITNGRIIVVFGSAGLRDVSKRSWMGSIAAEIADFTVITAEDPRTESLSDIMADIASGCVEVGGVEGKTFWKLSDRAEAIRFGVGMAERGDIVLACGKAHEQSMCFGSIEYPWDDRMAMNAAIAERLGRKTDYPPKLPTSEPEYYSE